MTAAPDPSNMLLAVLTNGTCMYLDNDADVIHEVIGGYFTIARMDGNPVMGYVDDDGLSKRLPLNVAASIIIGRLVYGTAVILSAEAGDEGEDLPAPQQAIEFATNIALRWNVVFQEAEQTGQDVTPVADPDAEGVVVEFHTFDSIEEYEAFLDGQGRDERNDRDMGRDDDEG